MALTLDGSNEKADIGGERIGDLRCADDIALLAEQENGLGLQKTLTGVAQVSQKIGMKISIQKTECHFNFWERETRSFAWRRKDRNWSKRRTLCIWDEMSAHKRGLTRM